MPQPTIIDGKLRAYPYICLLTLGLAACGSKTDLSKASTSPKAESVVISSGTIGTGGTIGQAFEQARVSPTEAFAAQQALNKQFSVRHARPEHRYEIHRSTSNTFVRFIYWPNSFESYVVVRSTTGGFVATHEEVTVTEERMGMRGELESSLWEAMEKQGVPAEMIWRFADVFGSRVDFLTEPRKGDTFRMVWTRDRYEDSVRDGDILYASYKNGQEPELFAFLLDNEYYDQNGRSMRGQFLRAPLSYRRISSGFNPRRRHPVLRIVRPHHGTDYAAPRGTPVQSIGSGLVIAVGWDGGLGKAVRIRHAGSYVSIYGHLSSFAQGLHVGQRVEQGQFIGRVGSTGLSTGPHLHFGFEKNGRLVDFLRQKFELKARTVPDSERERFRDLKKKALEDLAHLGNAPRKASVLNP